MKVDCVDLLTPVIGVRADIWGQYLDIAMEQYNINTGTDIQVKNRTCIFLANILKETEGLTKMEEDLWYRAPQILKTWPNIFKTLEEAAEYEKDSKKLGNKVYGRKNNTLGNTEPNDGYHFRGRGPMHTTGRYNYKLVSVEFDIDCMTKPELISQPCFGSLSAAYYWEKHKINKYCDKGDIRGARKMVNNGLLGLNEVVAYTSKLYRIFDTLKKS